MHQKTELPLRRLTLSIVSELLNIADTNTYLARSGRISRSNTITWKASPQCISVTFSPISIIGMALAFLSLLLLLLFPLSLLLTLRLIVRPKPVKIPIKNRHVFITGGSSGIGLALAQRAAQEGARVSILARSLQKLEEAKQSIRLATGIEVATYAADVRDFDAVKKAVNEAGPIDVLVVNQGVFVPQELEEEELDEVRFMIDVNLMGSFNMIKAALPLMKKRDGHGPASIAFMSSQAGQVGIYGYTAYSASKFGLRGLAEALQQEVIVDNIHVSLIFPPDTETPGLEEETKRRPQLTSIIAASSGAMKADEVAKKALHGIQSGSFIVPCNFEGLLLSIATAGLSPQRSFLMAFVEVFAAGIIRFAGLCFQWNWYGSIEKWHAQKRRKVPRSSWCLIYRCMHMAFLLVRSCPNGW
ncbi:hypothetical protein Patl1_25433 [Pistacia atlantica]|uniref:Uncharacterized protein n=1 Tax=Pistacia atlantica TaxID=434234 RepID=A0ACC1B269_9ROSI|nr:hypothetical protein Patl1_25433 [Pistacia atlantica]